LSSSASTVSRGALNRLSPLRLPVSPRPHCLIYSEGIGVGKALIHMLLLWFLRFRGTLGFSGGIASENFRRLLLARW
jgi:hypothetical protein